MKKLLFGTVFLLVASVLPVTAMADVQVGISIGVPPPLPFGAPSELVVVPSGPNYVYMVPGTLGLYFYGGYWYRFHGGHWFRAVTFNDPWVPVQIGLVPDPVVVVPHDYILNMPPGYHRIGYHDFHRNWRDWERRRHWHGQNWYRDHSRRHWAGQTFHRPPPGHPGHRGPYGKPVVGGPRGPHGKPGGPGYGGPPGKPGGHGPYGRPGGPRVGGPQGRPGGPGGGGPHPKVYGGPQGKVGGPGPQPKAVGGPGGRPQGKVGRHFDKEGR